MGMRVMYIRKMWMRVHHGLMLVTVRMRLTRRVFRAMHVLMMNIVNVSVIVLLKSMRMRMLMVLR